MFLSYLVFLPFEMTIIVSSRLQSLEHSVPQDIDGSVDSLCLIGMCLVALVHLLHTFLYDNDILVDKVY